MCGGVCMCVHYLHWHRLLDGFTFMRMLFHLYMLSHIRLTFSEYRLYFIEDFELNSLQKYL